MSSLSIRHDLFKAGFRVAVKAADTVLTVTDYFPIFEVVTTAIRSLTLAQPRKVGEFCAVVLRTDGGDLTLTVTGGYRAEGSTVLTFNDAGDFVVFVSVQVGDSYYWRVLAQEGVMGDMIPGTGISSGTGTICEHSVTKIGGLYRTTILVDLTGLNSGDADGDIIGKANTANCHIGQITAALNGTIFAGSVTCLETPAGGEPDIDLYAATEATGTEEAAVGDLTETALLAAAADWTAGTLKALTAFPAANKYLYLVASGGATNDTYTAGIFLIELWGK